MTSGIFGIARTALLAHQQSLQIISHNVANAETPGYSRQRPMLSANTPVRMPYGNMGTGVSFDGIERQRDVLLDQAFRSASSLLGESNARRDILSRVEDIFGEPADAGMANSLDQFWASFSDLASSPGSLSNKAVVQQRGRQLGQLFNQYDGQLTQTREHTNLKLDTLVSQINQSAGQIADLNGRIQASEVNGWVSSDLRDQRDVLIDQLAHSAGAKAEIQKDGSVTILIGNSTLVAGTSTQPLRLVPDPPVPPPAHTPSDIPVKLSLGNSADRLGNLGGELKALTDVINKDIPSIRSRLDALAASIVSAVNTAHSSGYVFSGNTPPGVAAGNFFDPGSITDPVRAGNMKLSAAIENDSGLIASSGDPNSPYDNSVALELSALRNDTGLVNWTGPNGTTETAGFNAFFRNTVTSLGLEVRRAADDTSVHSVMSDQADARRQSVSGVSTDEELVHLMRVQQSYVAATRLIKTADEMLQTILDLV